MANMTGAAPKILVVDDSAANRASYAGKLREALGVEVIEAASGHDALAAAAGHDFALALIDIQMPDMDGFELASLLRQEPRATVLPILFASEQAFDRAGIRRCYRMGAVDVLTPGPVDPEILLQKTRVYLQLYNKRQELEEVLGRIERENKELLAKNEEYRRAHEEMRQQATHDPLTNLPNRLLFEDRAEAAMRRARRSGRPIAIAYTDLDGFKAVNDRHGHATGDELIRLVGQRLSAALRASDTVARLGGDEFGVLMELLDSPGTAVALGEKLYRVLTQTARLQSELGNETVELRVRASIGIVLYPDHGATLHELLNNADAAMYEAKRAGGGVRVFSEDRRAREDTNVRPLRERRRAQNRRGGVEEPGAATGPAEKRHP
jgi:diguanylate cyclase (GGDEF)-like protein